MAQRLTRRARARRVPFARSLSASRREDARMFSRIAAAVLLAMFVAADGLGSHLAVHYAWVDGMLLTPALVDRGFFPQRAADALALAAPPVLLVNSCQRLGCAPPPRGRLLRPAAGAGLTAPPRPRRARPSADASAARRACRVPPDPRLALAVALVALGGAAAFSISLVLLVGARGSVLCCAPCACCDKACQARPAPARGGARRPPADGAAPPLPSRWGSLSVRRSWRSRARSSSPRGTSSPWRATFRPALSAWSPPAHYALARAAPAAATVWLRPLCAWMLIDASEQVGALNRFECPLEFALYLHPAGARPQP
jgi:hypothetical protein